MKGFKGADIDGSSSFIPLVTAFVQDCNDYSVTGIKSFHEAKFAAARAEEERERQIKEKLEERKRLAAEKREAQQRARLEREREEQERIAAEEERKRARAAFIARQNAMFGGGN